MATYYVGLGGNDLNNGLTWALRKLTLNGAEDVPVVAADNVIVGPGVYREQLVLDVSGNAGNPITYIADVTGENTDGVGGVVRVTGSDNDQTVARANCVLGNVQRNFRTFRGFRFDLATELVRLGGANNLIVEDCTFTSSTSLGLNIVTPNQANATIRRCVFIANADTDVRFFSPSLVDDVDHLVENCLFIGFSIFKGAVTTEKIGGIIVRNSTFVGTCYGVQVRVALTVGQTVTVNNCIFATNNIALWATVVGEIIENFNAFHGNVSNRNNVNTGASSNTFPPLFLMPILHSGESQASGFAFPWWFGELSEWSQVGAITGANEPTEELRGILRPVTASKNSWGPLQFADMERETGTVRTGSVSMAIRDAGRHQIWVPVTATSTTIQVYVYREANYAGLLPQMIIKQPGQADDVTTDVGAAGGWNLLTTTLVPAADPPYVVVELVSRNTNGAADEVFFDDLDVS